LKILVTWSGWRSPRRSWEWLTAEALRTIGNEVYLSCKPEPIPLVPDVVFSTDNLVLARHYVAMFNCPHVHWVIAGFVKGSPEKIENALLAVDLLLAISETTKTDFVNSFPHDVEDKLEIAYYGVSDGKEMMTNSVTKDDMFCFVGCPDDERKRYSWFAESVSLAGVPARIISPDPFNIDQAMSKLSVRGEIHTAVDNPKIFELLAKSQALICTSSWETWFLPAGEAFTVELPVISYKLPVIQELFEDVPFYFENIDECTWWIFELLENPKVGYKRGIEGRNLVLEKGFLLEDCARRLVRWFEQCISP